MKKKHLKNAINANGGFMKFNIESLANSAEAAGKKGDTPEGTISFSGIASNGDLNRNGYIITVDAWKKSIKAYMRDNPIVLLQHDMDQPIGQCTKMEITSKGLEVEGYIFDEYTDGRFGKGLFNAISTGHITIKYDFINIKTGEILPSADFWRNHFWDLEDSDKNYIDNWVRRITETEIIEFSLVSIPANRKSLITNREDLDTWRKGFAQNKIVNNNSNMNMRTLSAADLEQYPVLAEKYSEGESIAVKAWEAIAVENPKGDDPTKAEKVEKKVVAEKVNPLKSLAEKAKQRAVSLSKDAEEKVDEEKEKIAGETEAIKILSEAFEILANTIEANQEKIKTLEETLKGMPHKESVIVHNQYKAAKKEGEEGGKEEEKAKPKAGEALKALFKRDLV